MCLYVCECVCLCTEQQKHRYLFCQIFGLESCLMLEKRIHVIWYVARYDKGYTLKVNNNSNGNVNANTNINTHARNQRMRRIIFGWRRNEVGIIFHVKCSAHLFRFSFWAKFVLISLNWTLSFRFVFDHVISNLYNRIEIDKQVFFRSRFLLYFSSSFFSIFAFAFIHLDVSVVHCTLQYRAFGASLPSNKIDFDLNNNQKR